MPVACTPPFSASCFFFYLARPRYELPDGSVFDGADEVMRYWIEGRTAVPDQRNELVSIRSADDAVVVELDLLGTHEGPLRGHEPTGRTFRSRMAALFIFEDGGEGIVCERVYFDQQTISNQLRGVTAAGSSR